MAARDGAIDVTEFIMERVPEVYEELSSVVYDLDLLKKKGYTVKNDKVFAHAGTLLAESVGEAFAQLGLKSRTLRPGRIYLTASRRILTNQDRVVEFSGLYFFTDTLAVEEGDK